jgi:hypothetical protein
VVHEKWGSRKTGSTNNGADKPQTQEIAKIGALFVASYGHLSHEALVAGVRAWKMVPKFHTFVHLCERQSFINARFAWTYGDEDLQRIVKDIALACHKNTVAPCTLYRWLIGAFD